MNETNVTRNEQLQLAEQAQEINTANKNSSVGRLVNIVYYLFAALQLLLLVRILLHVIGANPDNGFTAFIYNFSAPFVALFATIFTNPTFSATSVLEVTTIIAMIAYQLLAWLIGRVIWLTLSRPR